MTFEDFLKYSKNYKTIPVYEIITSDLITPVLAYLKIRRNSNNSFLLESVESIGQLARYSFIGRNPDQIISNNGNQLKINSNGNISILNKNIFNYLSENIEKFNSLKLDSLPNFTGGIVGYLGFENIELIEEVTVANKKDELNIPDSIFGIYNTIIAFDHYKHQTIIINNVHLNETSNLKEEYLKAKSEINILKIELAKPITINSTFSFNIKEENNQQNEFEKIVTNCKKNIYEGDVIQIVPSVRFKATFEGDLFNVYRALRIVNPSPYMYYFELTNDIKIVGTSPEDLLRVQNKNATILPIAGTRKRGKTEAEDQLLETDLLNDKKEIAEHVMLLDLARNDLGRVCELDTVALTEKMSIHKFSHVMHIVSRVEGILSENQNCIDALKSSFPAGTVSGAPKIRAIQLINKYEKTKRNIYAGAIGYIDFRGNLDMCIAIRTFFAKGNKLYWQAGAGIVADSIPENEYAECLNKAAALKNALNFAEVINENFSN